MFVALVILAGVLVATWLGDFVVGKLISPYADQLNSALQKKDMSPLERGFVDGGRTIGWFERFLIYLFVISGNFTGVGFLIAAKSVFRFGELKEHHHRLEAEYITIGTLMSFSWGLAVAMLTKLCLNTILC